MEGRSGDQEAHTERSCPQPPSSVPSRVLNDPEFSLSGIKNIPGHLQWTVLALLARNVESSNERDL